MQAKGNFFINGALGRLNARLDAPESAPEPAQDQQCPLVILCHGFGGSLDFHLWPLLTVRLNELGIAVLCFDFNGCGQSDGQFQDLTIANEINDLLNVIAYARHLAQFSGISLLGYSQGGVVAGMVAGMCRQQIRSLVLMSASGVLRDDVLRGSFKGIEFDPWHLDKPFYEVPGRNLKLGRPYLESAMSLPIYETTAKYTGPVLILNGMADRVVPYTYGERYKQALPQGELLLIPGEEHSWSQIRRPLQGS